MMLARFGLGRKAGIALAAVLIALGASCSDSPTGPQTPKANDPSHLFGFPQSPQLLVCPTNQTLSTSALIGLDGGTVSIGGTSVTVPAGALQLLGPSTVELTIPAGQYVEVDLTVNGGQHATFQQPVVVTIDYSRCNPFQTLFKLLSVWNIDPTTKALLQDMGGFDNKLLQKITFTTLHFSGFAIAY